MFERIENMLKKEFIQVFRDPRMKAIIFVVPVFQLFVFGYAVTTDVRNIKTAVCDLDNSIASRELIARFVRSGHFQVFDRIGSPREAGDLIDRGVAQVVLQINHGFEERLRGGQTALVQVLVDGTDSNTAGILLSYAVKIAEDFSRGILVDRYSRLRGPAMKPAEIRLQTRAWFNENLESRNFYVPGVIAILVGLITLMLTSMAIVREKEIGTMEQIMVTPITSTEFILGKTAPFALIGFVDVLVVTVVGAFWFEVPIRGNVLLLLFATALYLMTTLGAGLLISTFSGTQQQAMMSTFFFFFPAVLLSGFIFPISNMPRVIQWVTVLNPLRYFLIIIRGIFLKGVGPEVLWPQMVALAVMGVLVLFLASREFRKTAR